MLAQWSPKSIYGYSYNAWTLSRGVMLHDGEGTMFASLVEAYVQVEIHESEAFVKRVSLLI